MANQQAETRTRLRPTDRRQQLLAVTSQIISEEGMDHVRIPYVATTAGVTRPVVYKFFPNRQALIKGVLEDFREELDRRLPQDIDDSTELLADLVKRFVDAACDTIEERGPGGWILFCSLGPDQEIAAISSEMRESFLAPWLGGIGELTGAPPEEASALGGMLFAAAGAVIQHWIDGSITRDQVVSLLVRSILAILNAFTV